MTGLLLTPSLRQAVPLMMGAWRFRRPIGNMLQKVLQHLTLVLLFVSVTVRADGFDEAVFPIVETEIEQTTLYGPGILGVWLGDEKILLNTLQVSSGTQEKRVEQVVIFDIKKEKSKVIVPSGSFVCRDAKSQVARIIKEGTDQFIKVAADGNVTNEVKVPNWEKFSCRLTDMRKPGRLQMFLSEEEGYIDFGKTGGGNSNENAVLYRRGHQPVELSVKGGEVSNALYIPHLKKYLLNFWDELSGKSLPIRKPVFRLMDIDGRITEIPQPIEFVRAVGSFSEARILRDGIVLNRTGPTKSNPGLYFLRGGRISRIFGADGQIATRLLPSPDGCFLAFLSFKNYNFSEKKTVKLINLCEG